MKPNKDSEYNAEQDEFMCGCLQSYAVEKFSEDKKQRVCASQYQRRKKTSHGEPVSWHIQDSGLCTFLV